MDCGAMSSGIFCSLQLTELDRILSNLINNAYEAISGRGKITVTLSVLSGTAQVSVKDTGKGIPKELLPKIGLAHQTFGKKDGNGLGVFYAKTVVASWGGSLVIDSVEGQGTTITIGIPLADTPTWFASELNIRPNSLVVIADDDPSIHALWKQKLAILKNVTSTLKTVHLNSGKDLLNWYREFALSDRPEDQTEHVVYFCDYEFSGESQNGIDLLEMMGASRQSVLFTSRWNEKSVLDRCERLHIRLLPKQLANHVVLSPAAGNT
jgi:anti-sigma regulatory factor (Ser/Thr protein kinase)